MLVDTQKHASTHAYTHRHTLYLQWVLGADGKDLVLEVAELTAPGASLADPTDEAWLVGTAHRSVTATRAQQLPLQETEKENRDSILLNLSIYSALRKYSAPLNFATFCHISGFKHKDIKLYFFCEESTTSGTQS